MTLKLQPLPEINHKIDDLIQTIKDYEQDKDYNETELELSLDRLLCNLPRHMIYVEWYDRSQIKDMADSIYDEPADEDTVDNCMYELWDNDNSMMDNDIVYSIVNDTVVGLKKGE